MYISATFANFMNSLLYSGALLKKSYKTLDPEVHNGSPLLGLQGTVVKSHGSASSKAFYHAIKQAIEAVTDLTGPQR